MSTVLLLDLETTGLIENRSVNIDKLPEVIEFYGVVADLDDGRPIDELELLIRPRTMPLPDKIVEITGITSQDLEGKPSFRDVHDQIFSMVESANTIITHNASFDAECLEIEAQRLGVELRLPRLLCSVEQTVGLTGQRLSLSALHQFLFGLKFADAHRAREDTLALLRCCVELRRRDLL